MIKDYASNEFIDIEFESETENTCDACGRARDRGDTLCPKCREEFDALFFAWQNASEGVKELFKGEIDL